MQARMVMGRYVAADSWIHHLDPRAKLGAMVLFLIAVILASRGLELSILTAFAVIVLLSSRVPLTRYIRAAKPLWPLMAFMFLFYTLFEHGGDIWLQWGSFRITSEGVLLGLFAAWRMFLLISFTSILTFTTTPIELNLGLESALKPLSIIGVSAQSWTMMITISLRFIPTIFQEAEKLLKAQASRGADYQDLKLIEKAKMLLTLMVPVTVGAFRRAEELVMAMEARGYVLDAKRTSLRTLQWSVRDTVFVLLFVILLSMMIVL